MDQEPHVVWPIVAKHLEDAEFALARFDAGLSSASLTLDKLAAGPERIFLANVDGLVVGGAPVVERLLVPGLAAKKPPSPHRVAAIVVTLLHARRAPLAMRALTHEAPKIRQAAVRGCALGAGSSLDPWITQSLANARSNVSRAVLLDLAADRGLAVDSLAQSLHSDDPEELAAALRVACRATQAHHEARILALLQHAHPGVRDAAIVTSLHHGSLHGWDLCQALAFDLVSPHPLAMSLVAGLGEPGQHKRLASMIGSEAHAAAALRALGFTGNVGVVPLLLHYAQSGDAAMATLATEALGTILGSDVDRLLADKAPRASIADFWQNAHGGFDAGRRYLAGIPASRAAFALALTHFPTRRRYLLSLLLSIRTGGISRVSTRALSAQQRTQIFAIGPRGGAEEPWLREFSVF